ncbi:hypothetical protein [Marinifilum sp. D714]|uniref:hypothetical protein n=1 Tax=Marinifilum sp. D714 TaxID=2937523 RepID=UPI0027C1A3E2|nr:hypothetical protein [Marinifilum sp. D714]MDQ2180546.1 hypothetical protein [Marinifilum sp. D714]
MKENRSINLSYPELIQRADRVAMVVQRDITEFQKYGYAENVHEEVAAKCLAFKEVESDMFWEGQKVLATNKKENCKGKLVEILGEFAFKSKLALGEHTKEYKMFRFTGLKKLNDKELIPYASHVIKTARLMPDELAKRNLTIEDFTAAESATKALDDAIDAQADAIAVREQKSLERLNKGSELYKMISELCDVGKRIWEHKNEAFYNDYVLFGSSKSTSHSEEEETESVVEETSTGE